MSLSSRCAVDIIARSIDTATKLHGGNVWDDPISQARALVARNTSNLGLKSAFLQDFDPQARAVR